MTPKILSMKVWELCGEPVFYGFDAEDSVYSAIDRTIAPKPSHMHLMTSRDLEPKDLSGIILHNLMTSEDFDSLKQAGLVPPEMEILFQKIQDLNKQIETLKEASTRPEVVEKSGPEAPLNKTVIEAIINIVKNGISGASSGVFEEILSNCSGLSEQDKNILKLVSSHFSLGTTEFQ